MADHPSFLDRVRGWLAPSRKLAPKSLAGEASFGKYRLIREIGRGGAGVVHEAEDVDLRRRVAVKILKEDEADPVQVRRLHREAAIAAQLRHPNIVSVYDVGMIPGPSGRALHFIAMEYVDGRPFSIILRDGQWTLESRIDVLEQFVRGVAHAHSHGMLHRDLKPANILVDRDGRAVLSDFGLARATAWHTRLTDSHSVLGSPSYMAPEQVAGRTREIDERTDVYACGVILYEILCGALPFSADTPAALFQKILTEEPPPPSKRRPGVDSCLEAICLRAMARERKLRYSCGQDFLDDLERWKRREPLRARSRSAERRSWGRWAIGGALAAAAVAALGIATHSLRKQREASGHRKSTVHGSGADADSRREEIREALLLLQREAEALRARARTRRQTGDCAGALADYAEAIRLCPDDARSYSGRAVVKNQMKDFDGAIADCAEALRWNPDSVDARYEMGQSKTGKGDFVGAIAEFTEVLRRKPDDSDAVACRGRAKLKSGDADGAIADFTERIRIRPGDVDTLTWRGEARWGKGDANGALADFTEALRLAPDDLVARTDRAEARAKCGDNAGAIEDLAHALNVAPAEWPKRQAAARRLEELRAQK